MTINHTLRVLTTAAAVACTQAQAYDFKLDNGVEGTLDSVITLGTQVRAHDPSPDAYGATPSKLVHGVTPGMLAGQNGGSDLNFYKGQAIATDLKAVVGLDLKKDKVGLFVRASAWRDFSLGNNNAAYGNFPNDFTPGVPLSDRGFDGSSQFSNAEVRDYFLYGSIQTDGGKTLDGRLGRQVLNWGGSRLISSGINAAINPADSASQLRPGALPFESKLPLGMLSAKLASGTAWSLEGYAAYEHRGNVYPACGTYFDAASFVASGCNMISFVGASEQQRLATDAYVHRSPDVHAGGGNDYGVALGYKAEALQTDFKFYALHTASVSPSFRMTVNSTAAGTAATHYGLIYPENVSVFGTSFRKAFSPETAMYGELAYRPDQPLSFNASDLLSAFYGRGPTALLALRKGVLSIPVGGTFDAYDRYGVVTGSVGVNRTFPKVMGAERVVVTGEVGFSSIDGLPSPDAIRFGRGTAYGSAAYVGANGALTACTDTVPGKTCSTEGYTSSNSWGVRLLVSATYPASLAGATLTPSLLLSSDVQGYSYDGTFSRGRTLVRPGVRVDWAHQYYLELQYSKFSGGSYNLLADRDFLSAVAGIVF